MRVPKFSVGQPTRRMEDIGLLTGNGCYSDDFRYPDEVHAVFVRSAVAHADIGAPDISSALEVPGVLTVLTGQDWKDEGLGELNGSGFFGILDPKRRDGQDWFRPIRLPLAVGRVRYLGEPIAVVVAETQNAARDAAELVDIPYNPLPIVTDTAEANAPGTVQIYDDCERNESFVYEVGDKDATDLAFSSAPLVIKQKFVINRMYASPIEPRSVLARYNAPNGKYEIKVGAQSPNDLRRSFGTMMLKVDPNNILSNCSPPL
ncbi:xanthine dehydrogenase family protein molybdopterin-binding subunit [Hoeflea sp.]|uniref:xanthine dehydrogenase family protein molybdopterin-binding subunit n=1 Tax=Hoeflea sp. TaxID=1940281 RepID=UPI003B02E3F9